MNIYTLLANTPIWLIALVLWVTFDVVIYLLRDLREGLGYQVSWTAKIGDGCLMAAVLIAATILKRPDVWVPNQGILDAHNQIGMFGILIGVGAIVCVLTLGKRSGQAADIYHDIIVVPTIAFLGITLMPIVIYDGSRIEHTAVSIFIALWGCLILFDTKTKRMNQRRWLVNHGFPMKGEIPEW